MIEQIQHWNDYSFYTIIYTHTYLFFPLLAAAICRGLWPDADSWFTSAPNTTNCLTRSRLSSYEKNGVNDNLMKNIIKSMYFSINIIHNDTYIWPRQDASKQALRQAVRQVCKQTCKQTGWQACRQTLIALCSTLWPLGSNRLQLAPWHISVRRQSFFFLVIITCSGTSPSEFAMSTSQPRRHSSWIV